jgi:hypothetical protein
MPRLEEGPIPKCGSHLQGPTSRAPCMPCPSLVGGWGRACMGQAESNHGSDTRQVCFEAVAQAGSYLDRLKIAMATRRVVRERL